MKRFVPGFAARVNRVLTERAQRQMLAGPAR